MYITCLTWLDQDQPGLKGDVVFLLRNLEGVPNVTLLDIDHGSVAEIPCISSTTQLKTSFRYLSHYGNLLGVTADRSSQYRLRNVFQVLVCERKP